MKGIRFYADIPGTHKRECNPRDGEQSSWLLPKQTTLRQLREYAALGGTLNVVALLLGPEHQCPDYLQECLAATFSHPDSCTSLGSVSRAYLRNCRRIPETLARALHPALFVRLDNDE